MKKIIIGSITMPFSLSDNERLLWLEEWVYSSKEGLLGMNCGVDLVFSFEKDLNETTKFLLEDNRFILMNTNEFIAPNGVIYKLILDEEAEKILTELKKK